MEEEIKIQIFDEKCYNIWKKRILMYLKWKKCDEAVIRVKLPTDSETTWHEKNLRAINYIYCSISNDQLEFVDEEVTAYGIMKNWIVCTRENRRPSRYVFVINWRN